ncbi:chemotaxis-specific protein-glutamate methyltransferase CheB [Pyxidicoccus xibeiensis]|uniref:chemotaxis-specific protein-glutamate methyltransferase CheB n=1 Tax=Pyxidicoccus xibeiensis TaxID=2906759 RepID=UPI0020A7AF7F|nr:chemotaxis-specific protein-glutamate methyltransferase CheB [Pyxidicoccus xibeiensis]MCP3139084.1 chemotaxis-specific protein-glutamate methyltransferase CheB [Pyxidicoccus xibeiensis]
MTGSGAPLLRVLVVDASAVVRQDVAALLRAAGGFEVSAAANAPAALQKLQRVRPEVVLLCIQPPDTAGLPLLRELVTRGVPVVVCVKARVRDEVVAREALRAGASTLLHWPVAGLRAHLAVVAGALAVTLLSAGRPSPRAPARQGTAVAVEPRPRPVLARTWARQVVAVGASTGGPAALRQLLSALPEDAPGLLVVQHMPEPFATSFARNLAEECRVTVRRAESGDRVCPGTALMAPGDQHLRLVACTGGLAVELSDEPPFRHHRPSVDVLFRSVAEVAGPDAVGVLLTGMGDDGADGLMAMLRAGAATFAQDEATSVVYGMPRAAVLRGAAEHSLPLDALPAAILDAASRRGPSPAHARPLHEDAG